MPSFMMNDCREGDDMPKATSRTLNDLGQTLIAQLAEIVTGGDESIPPSPGRVLSWAMPGLPFEAADFNFAAKGLGSGANAEEEKLLTQQASDFARIVDFIPDLTVPYNNDKQQTIFKTSEARMSHMYGEILKASKVVKSALTDAETAKVEKFRKLLRTTKKVKDIITDEEKEVPEDGPALKAYNEKMLDYINAALLYNSKRVAAQTATGVEGKPAVLDFRTNAQLYRMQVKAAADAWTSSGFRNEVDQMNAYINQVGQRDMVLWKQRLLEMYDDAVLTDAGNSKFFYTGIIPGNFANSKGWTSFSMSHESVMTKKHADSRTSSAAAGMSFGLFGAGGKANSESSTSSGNMAVSNFNLSFEMTQAVISRGWCYPEFFMNQGWMLEPGSGWTFDAMPSDGKAMPTGTFIGYPTAILFVRKLTIHSAEFASAYRQFAKSVGGGGSVGWGPFRLSGSHSRSESGAESENTDDTNTVSVDGMQAIGFIEKIFDQPVPNPLRTLKPADFQ
jgi:hypothetical protein